MTFGWTIEAQIAAAKLDAAICEIPVRGTTPPRRRGRKSPASRWQRTLSIGCQIVAAGSPHPANFRPRAGARADRSSPTPAATGNAKREVVRLLLVTALMSGCGFRQTTAA